MNPTDKAIEVLRVRSLGSVRRNIDHSNTGGRKEVATVMKEMRSNSILMSRVFLKKKTSPEVAA